MSRDEMIKFMNENPNIKITHTLFDQNEYIYQKEKNGEVYDEDGNLFDDWHSGGINKRNGVRMRTGGNWENGWDVKRDNETCKLLSKTNSGREYLYNSLCKTCQRLRTCKYL